MTDVHNGLCPDTVGRLVAALVTLRMLAEFSSKGARSVYKQFRDQLYLVVAPTEGKGFLYLDL